MCEGWISNHRRFLRRRSTDSDVCIVVTEAQEDSTETMRNSILALYGVHSSCNCSVAKEVTDLCDEEGLALGDHICKSPEGPAQDMALVELTMSPQHSCRGRAWLRHIWLQTKNLL